MMKIKKNLIFITLSTVAVFTLSGCGGNSGTSSSSLDTQTTPVSASNTEVQVIDGYVVGATVTALNDPTCKAVTGKDGKATLLCKPLKSICCQH